LAKLTNKQNIVNLYNDGYSVTKIAEIEGCHRSSVQYALLKNNIKLRKRTTQDHYNVHFFSTYNSDSCYWAGFFAADGHIRKNGQTCDLHLANIDLHHLEKFNKIIGRKNIIEYCKDGSVRTTVSGQWFVNDLNNNFGVSSKKSFTLRLSSKIPKEYLSDYTRGYFDGDGCITIAKYGGKEIPVANFTSNLEFLNTLRSLLTQEVEITLKSKNNVTPIHKRGEKLNYGSISFSGENAFKILDWMYKKSNSNTRLDRKFNTYIESKVNKNKDILTTRGMLILNIIKENKFITNEELSMITGWGIRNVSCVANYLRKKKLVKNIINNKDARLSIWFI